MTTAEQNAFNDFLECAGNRKRLLDLVTSNFFEAIVLKKEEEVVMKTSDVELIGELLILLRKVA